MEKMKSKQEYIEQLKIEKKKWEDLLASLSEEQILAPDLLDSWSIKDVIAHLMAWQKTTSARLQAGLSNQEPRLPDWPWELESKTEDQPHEMNAWIYNHFRDQPWSIIYRDWWAGFQNVIDQAEAIPEANLLAANQYPWLEGYSLADVLQGSYDHHEEHYEWLTARLREERK
jgi:hypothetical protein